MRSAKRCVCIALVGSLLPVQAFAGLAAPAPPPAPFVGSALPCANGRAPQLTIDLYDDLSLPVEDPWQVLFNEVPISDMQLALWANDDAVLQDIRGGLERRAPLIFAGIITAAVGAAAASVGWALVGGAGDNHLSNATTLSLALGGFLVSVAGILMVGEFVQTPLEPFLAPTPVHRMTREHAQDLVTKVNDRLLKRTCPGAASDPKQP